jgi:hypothetical protein
VQRAIVWATRQWPSVPVTETLLEIALVLLLPLVNSGFRWAQTNRT